MTIPIRSSGSAIWTPGDIGGLILDLNGDLGVTLVSGKVSAWADQSGTQVAPSQGTAANRPTIGAPLNGHARLAFTSPQFLTHSLRLVPPCTLVAIAETTSVAADFAGIGVFSSGLGGPLLFARSSSAQRWGIYANAVADSGQALTSSKVVIAAIRAFNDIDLYTNGVKVTVATGVSGFVVANAIGASNGSGTQNLEGLLARLLAFNKALVAAEAAEVTANLMSEYAL